MKLIATILISGFCLAADARPVVIGVDQFGPELASWEQLDEAGHVGAYGIAYNPRAMTCATRLWPQGAVLRVTEVHNGLSVIVTVVDRNPPGRAALDLSWAAFGVLDGHALGVAEVKVEVIK